ncbi:uncharacterized protein VTP21DRAFT_10231 [Calcarisporiella thermophila]|uniref:uncharacterized protein n=1 Tax=Calcarisporiella thermophila TaxID=911321 RepID=UPI0037422E6F
MTTSRSLKLFQPIKLGNYILKHRVAMAPLTRFRADENRVPTDLTKTYYEQRSSEGGLIITEATYVSELAGNYPNVPGIYTKEQIQGWRRVTNAVHAKGGLIFMQLWFMGRADVVPSVSASAIPISGHNLNGKTYPTPRALETSEIPHIVDTYKQAALNAIEAGFDGVEIHGASGYLIDQFLQSNSNHRTDQYGGLAENRIRLALEVIGAVSEAIGQSKTAIRLSPYSSFQDMHDAFPVDTFSVLTKNIQEKFPRLAYLHFVESRVDDNQDNDNPIQSLGPFRKIWKGTLLRAGGFTPESATEIAEKYENDVIVFGRYFISNPDLPLRVKNGWRLNNYNRNTFYSAGAKEGYIDYPFYKDSTF